jgi:CheY-like chemotaxis protein
MAKVLIVEDEPLVARMYQKALEYDTHQVMSVIGGDKAVIAAKEYKPDIIMMDVMMPVVNGIDALTNLKKDPETAGIPVVMLTNLSGTHDAELAKERGAQDFWVKKDVKPRELGQKIVQILQGINPPTEQVTNQNPQE